MVERVEYINKTHGTLENTCQCNECLQRVLARTDAQWLLASILFPAIRPQPEDQTPVREIEDPHLVHIAACIIYVDASTRHEIAFKLLPCTQAKLVHLHRDICLAHDEIPPPDGVDVETRCRALNKAFAHVIDTAVFQASVSELENVEADGSGELLGDRPGVVKKAILDIMFRFLPTDCAKIVGSDSILTVYTDSIPR